MLCKLGKQVGGLYFISYVFVTKLTQILLSVARFLDYQDNEENRKVSPYFSLVKHRIHTEVNFSGLLKDM